MFKNENQTKTKSRRDENNGVYLRNEEQKGKNLSTLTFQ